MLYLCQRPPNGLNDHVLPKDHDEGEYLEEDRAGDGREAGLLTDQGRVADLLRFVVERQLQEEGDKVVLKL